MRLRSVLRIARWEAVTGAGGFDRRTVVVSMLVVLAIAALLPAVAALATPPDAALYRVGVAPSHPYHQAVAETTRFRVVEPDPAAFSRGEIDLLIRDRRVRAPDTRKGRAAAAALASAVEGYNDRLMRSQSDRAAAFPVSVHVEYVSRDLGFVARRAATGSRAGGGAGGGDGGSGDDGGGDAGGQADGSDGTAAGEASGSEDGFPSIGGSAGLVGESTGAPSDISPPFPFTSLVLAFAFVVPMNFLIQAYASSVLHERTNRRGELLLIAPVSSATIVAGKTLPYFAAMAVIATLTAAILGGGPIAVLAVQPIAVLFLACAFVGALLARSHKELTFVLVTVSVVVTTYVFVPAIFTQVHPIAAISPLTLVVRDLEGAAIAPETAAFSTIPVLVAAGVLFGLGTGMYREEDLFARRPLPAKALDGLANPIRGRSTAALMSMVSMPFVFLAELLVVAVLFLLPLRLSLPILLVAIAVVEEVAKSLHVYAGFRRGRYERSLGSAAVVGALSGVGFFLGEKAAVVAQLVGLSRLELGRAAFDLGAGVGGASGLALLALLLAPLVLHAATAGLSAVGASRGRRFYVAGFVAAVLLHAAYNLAVVTSLG